MREMGLLGKDDIEVRIGEVKEYDGKKYVTLLLYKTARVDMRILDEKFGQFGWQNEYKTIDGKMYAGISVFHDKLNEWITKWNVGTESNIEAAKGEASDAFKRAGYLWGIGTELYSSPRITVYEPNVTVKVDDYKGTKKFRCSDSFSVSEIEYDNKENIRKLAIWNDTKGKECFRWVDGKRVNSSEELVSKSASKTAKEIAKEIVKEAVKVSAEGKLVCENCGAEISQRVRDYSMDKYGRALCMTCQNKA